MIVVEMWISMFAYGFEIFGFYSRFGFIRDLNFVWMDLSFSRVEHVSLHTSYAMFTSCTHIYICGRIILFILAHAS